MKGFWDFIKDSYERGASNPNAPLRPPSSAVGKVFVLLVVASVVAYGLFEALSGSLCFGFLILAMGLLVLFILYLAYLLQITSSPHKKVFQRILAVVIILMVITFYLLISESTRAYICSFLLI